MSYVADILHWPDKEVAIASNDPRLYLRIYAQSDASDWAAITATLNAVSSSYDGASVIAEPVPDAITNWHARCDVALWDAGFTEAGRGGSSRKTRPAMLGGHRKICLTPRAWRSACDRSASLDGRWWAMGCTTQPLCVRLVECGRTSSVVGRCSAPTA